jgi:tetratricopeptide (TPR) repeat protein
LLTETGLIGFALLGGAFVAAGLAVWRRQRELVFVVALFVAATLVDIHWDFLAAGAVAFTALGSLLAVGVRPARRDPLFAAGAAAVALAALYSLAAPWAADRRLDAAYRAIDDGDLPTAVDDARRARSLNPLSVEPLFARGQIEEARGQFDVAREAYATAIEVQPENRQAWYLLGRLEYDVKRYEDAYQRFNRMYALDPRGPHVEWVQRSRCRINPTGC